jgi:hypothetical protein
MSLANYYASGAYIKQMAQESYQFSVGFAFDWRG